MRCFPLVHPRVPGLEGLLPLTATLRHRALPMLALALFAMPASATQSNPEPAPAHSWTARVHLLSDDARVELRHLGVGNDVLVCKAPCGVAVSFRASDVFRLDGTGLRQSETFHLPPRAGDLTMRVSARDQGPRVAGVVLLVAGSAAAAIGGILAVPAFAFGDVFCDQDPQCAAGNSTRRATFLGVFLGGVVVAALGTVLVVTSKPTTFTVDP
jgi:hypothetical protein